MAYDGIWITTPPRWFWKPAARWQRIWFPIARLSAWAWARITRRVTRVKNFEAVITTVQPVEFPK